MKIKVFIVEMANIIRKGHNENTLLIVDRENWDTELVKESSCFSMSAQVDDKTIAYIPMNGIESDCIDGDSGYTWDGAIFSSGYTLDNVGLTCVDNGLIEFDKDTITEDDFLKLYSATSLEMPFNDVLHFCRVYSNNKLYKTEINSGEGNQHITFNGGFLQGTFRTEGDLYNILPLTDCHFDEDMHFHFEINPTRVEEYEDGTINKKYKENSGIFFYLGLRAENKWFKYYPKKEESYENGDIVKVRPEHSGSTSFNFETAEGYKIKISRIHKFTSNNKHLTYSRTKEGHIASQGNIDTPERFWYDARGYKDNAYKLFNRTKDGHVANAITDDIKNGRNSIYDITSDLYSNAIAFRITEEGAVGFRYLVRLCDENNNSSIGIIDEYSKPSMVNFGTWSSVHYTIEKLSDEEMRILIYVNENLVYVSSHIPMLKLRQMNDIYEKQELVPFCISLGGGTLGLGDVVYDTYSELPTYQLPLERYFAGTFIGGMKNFKILKGKLEYEEIKTLNNTKK